METLQLCLVKPNLKEVWEELNKNAVVSVAYSTFCKTLKETLSYRDYANLCEIARERLQTAKIAASTNPQNALPPPSPSISKPSQSVTTGTDFRKDERNPFRKIDLKKEYEF